MPYLPELDDHPYWIARYGFKPDLVLPTLLMASYWPEGTVPGPFAEEAPWQVPISAPPRLEHCHYKIQNIAPSGEMIRHCQEGLRQRLLTVAPHDLAINIFSSSVLYASPELPGTRHCIAWLARELPYLLADALVADSGAWLDQLRSRVWSLAFSAEPSAVLDECTDFDEACRQLLAESDAEYTYRPLVELLFAQGAPTLINGFPLLALCYLTIDLRAIDDRPTAHIERFIRAAVNVQLPTIDVQRVQALIADPVFRHALTHVAYSTPNPMTIQGDPTLAERPLLDPFQWAVLLTHNPQEAAVASYCLSGQPDAWRTAIRQGVDAQTLQTALETPIARPNLAPTMIEVRAFRVIDRMGAEALDVLLTHFPPSALKTDNLPAELKPVLHAAQTKEALGAVLNTVETPAPRARVRRAL